MTINNINKVPREPNTIGQKITIPQIVCLTVSIIAAGFAVTMEFLTRDHCVSFSILYCVLIFASMISISGSAHMSGSRRAVSVTVMAVMALIFAALSFSSTFFFYMDLSTDNIGSIASKMAVSSLLTHGIVLAAALLVSRLLIYRKK